MNQHLQKILDLIEQNEKLTAEEKATFLKEAKATESDLAISQFKLERTEKVKRTTAILLEETIEELEQKRKAVEAQNRELEIESALEKVRTAAMAMNKAADMLEVCRLIAMQLEKLGVQGIRNVQTAIFYVENCTYMNYEYYVKHDKSIITETSYSNHPIHQDFANQMMKGKGEFFSTLINQEELPRWIAYQKTTNVFIDQYLETASSLSYYWFSLGEVALGLSAYGTLSDNELALFKRFLNVFELAFRRHRDIEKAESSAREAKIEASLERVRAQAMAMRTPEDLTGICEVLYAELQTLGFTEIRNAMINIHDDDKSSFVNYDYSDEIGKTISHLTYAIHPLVEKQIKQVRSAEGFSETSFTGKELKEWIAFRKKVGEKDDPRIEKAEALYYYLYSIGTGSLGISTFGAIAGQKIDVLKRFRNVFTLAYQRYTDIAQAEAQAKEARIELSLERVRARTMAMHKSEELVDTAIVLFHELKTLGIETLRTGVGIINKEDQTVEIWSSQLIEQKENKILGVVPLKNHPFWEGYFNAWKDKKPYFSYSLAGNEVKKYYEAMSSIISYSEQDKFNPAETFNTFFFTEGSLNVVTRQSLSEEECELLVRFARVFGQIYRRFLDLQQAEAQAKEARIEAALERIRSRTMGMQKSEELKEVIQVVYEQFVQLNIHVEHTGFVMDYKTRDDYYMWIADHNGAPSQVIIPNFDCVYYNRFNEAKEKGEDFFVTNLDFEEKNRFYQQLFEHVPGLPDEARKFYFSCTGLAASTVLLENIALYIENFSGIPFTDEDNNTLMRFGKVFQQTYTRFLDLQKAEAQAREAKIEAALERTRTQSMIMQHSTELGDTLRVFHEQVQSLGINSAFSFLWLPDEQNDKHIFWAAWEEDENGSTVFKNKAISYPLNRNGPATAQCLLDWRSDEPIHSYAVAPVEVENYFAAWAELFEGAEKLKPGYFSRGLYYVEAFMKYGCFGVMVEKDLAKEEKKILGRFATEFERTYTRFLDLQKAEAQAREALIEAALERVRSRTMAMHRTDQLLDAAELVYKELTNLGITSMAISYAFVNEQERNALYYGINPVDGKIPPIPFVFPHTETGVMQTILSNWKKQEPFAMMELDEETTIKHQTWAGKHIQTTFGKNNIPFSVKEFLSVSPKTAVIYNFNFTQGYLFIIGEERLSAAQEEMVVRFAKVFEMTYRRFLDLQKAEAQAKESQIELGLERVRSRAMAMQTSEELKVLIAAVFTELTKLDLVLTRCVIWIIDKETESAQWWMANSEDPNNPGGYYIPCHEARPYQVLLNEWKNQQVKFVYDLQGKEKKEWDDFLFSQTGLVDLPKPVQDGMRAPDRILLSISFNNFGGINVASLEPLTDEHFDILLRFAKVFDLTYTRFNDLKQAEAQAREAKIEAALERVRASTMAMQKSADLADASRMLFAQMNALVPNLWSCGFVLCDKSKSIDEWYLSGGNGYMPDLILPNVGDRTHHNIYQSWLKGASYHEEIVEGKELQKHYEWLMTIPVAKAAFDAQLAAGIARPVWQQLSCAYFTQGYLVLITDVPIHEEEILKRFAKVFEQTYTRFLDLQKAEAQAREAKIEAALERVRSQSMAMHHSENLHEVINVLSEQLLQLNFHFDTANFITNYTKEGLDMWSAAPGVTVPSKVYIPYADVTFSRILEDAVEKKLDFLTYTLSFEEKNDFFNHFFRNTGGRVLPEERKEFIYNSKGLSASVVLMDNVFLSLVNYQAVPYTDDENNIIRRFGKVFGQSYTRFLDLQKAEAQARESTIEVALERVRAKAMAMHKSEDLAQAVTTVFNELDRLDLGILRCGIGIINKEKHSVDFWATSVSDGEAVVQVAGDESMDTHDLLRGAYKAWLDKEDFSYILEGDDLVEYYGQMAAIAMPLPPSQLITKADATEKQYYHVAVFEQGGLFAFKESEFPEESKAVMKRFANVFNLTYKRFLDLQKAEAQAREAQIEAGLERVRYSAMAMQSSEDVGTASAVVFNEISLLGVEAMRCGITVIHPDKTADVWAATATSEGKEMKGMGRIDFNDHPLWTGLFEAWRNKEENFTYALKGEDLKSYYNALAASPNYNSSYIKGQEFPDHFFYACFFEQGAVFTFSRQPHEEEKRKVLKRFTAVFSLTFRRYLDLKQAEAQAREAQVETALERVRAVAMAMRRPEELMDISEVIYKQLQALGFLGLRNVQIAIDDGEKPLYNGVEYSEYYQNKMKDVPYDTAPLFKEIVSEIKKSSTAFYQKQVTGKEFDDWRKWRMSVDDENDRGVHPGLKTATSMCFYLHSVGNGMLGISTFDPISSDQVEVLKRFKNVFELSYRRYIDIQNAEAQAREAQVESALEKVRSRTLAMQKSDELADTAAEVFKQLINLGIEPNRLYIGIVIAGTRDMEMWATDEDGTGIGKKFTFNADDNISVGKLYQGWAKKERSVSVDMSGRELEEYIEYLKKLNIPLSHALTQNRRVQSVAYFDRGFIGMASPDEQSQQNIHLLERFAAVFNLTFTRFNDLKLAEAHALQAEQDLEAIKEAKQRAEEALSELQSAQKQLVQSEKMASLGELTAGIAHEIQNPLNFVNNFSEVSKELLDEMRTELESGNIEEAMELANDVIQNLQKINHHGKRADGIVKGMLQHSRSSNGVKELTDINSLADEYLRLSYHGLRAKDKSFNAIMKTDYDDTIGKISVLPQDLGRVILNLLTNAFYAVQQKQKDLAAESPTLPYEPTVTVSTKKIGDKVEIRVADNGDGIPPRVLEKIFQPFFTTKPTGQGTGLGLSLSYDIITKGHGGELKVETNEKEGTEFIIVLPA